MKRKKDRKPKIVIKTRNGGHSKLYVNGKWQRNVTKIDFIAVADNEIVKENHIVRI